VLYLSYAGSISNFSLRISSTRILPLIVNFTTPIDVILLVFTNIVLFCWQIYTFSDCGSVIAITAEVVKVLTSKF